MKKSIKTLFAITILFLAVSVQNVSAQEKTKMDAWPEMKAFHETMSKTFHPAEEGNLAPIKAMSGELSARAAKWAKSTGPKSIPQAADVMPKVLILAGGCKDLDGMIKRGASDDEIKNLLTSLHAQFHEIVGACIKEGDETTKTESTPAKSTTAPKKAAKTPAKTK